MELNPLEELLAADTLAESRRNKDLPDINYDEDETRGHRDGDFDSQKHIEPPEDGQSALVIRNVHSQRARASPRATPSNDRNLWMALGLVTRTGAPSRG